MLQWCLKGVWQEDGLKNKTIATEYLTLPLMAYRFAGLIGGDGGGGGGGGGGATKPPKILRADSYSPLYYKLKV